MIYTYTRRGFTLIELLVVVLIIAILAAVALPQYQRAVIKSRFAGAKINLKTLSQAKQVCQLAKGTKCQSNELDVDIPFVGDEDFMYITDIESEYVAAEYGPEEVCLCLFNSGEFAIFQSEEANCSRSGVTKDYAQLLQIPFSDECQCC